MVRFSAQVLAPSKRLRVSGPEEEAGAMPIPSAPSVAASRVSDFASASSNLSAPPEPPGVLATLDVDTLDCSVCMESLMPPIFQCSNGHIACHNCRAKMSDICPTCSQPMGSIRCLAIEKLIETMRVTCKYAEHGCSQMPKFMQKSVHEKSCEFKPCSCPIKPCTFNAPLRELSTHLLESHQVETYNVPWEICYTLWLNSATSYFLLRVDASHFLLHQEKEQLGSLVYLTHFGPASQDYTYQLEVKCEKKRLLYEGIPQSIAHPVPVEFLMIPQHMYPREGHLQLEVSLRRMGNSSSVKKKITFSETMF